MRPLGWKSAWLRGQTVVHAPRRWGVESEEGVRRSECGRWRGPTSADGPPLPLCARCFHEAWQVEALARFVDAVSRSSVAAEVVRGALAPGLIAGALDALDWWDAPEREGRTPWW